MSSCFWTRSRSTSSRFTLLLIFGPEGISFFIHSIVSRRRCRSLSISSFSTTENNIECQNNCYNCSQYSLFCHETVLQVIWNPLRLPRIALEYGSLDVPCSFWKSIQRLVEFLVHSWSGIQSMLRILTLNCNIRRQKWSHRHIPYDVYVVENFYVKKVLFLNIVEFIHNSCVQSFGKVYKTYLNSIKLSWTELGQKRCLSSFDKGARGPGIHMRFISTVLLQIFATGV